MTGVAACGMSWKPEGKGLTLFVVGLGLTEY